MSILDGVHARRAFVAAIIVFMSLSTVALASTDPIPGVDVVVRRKPPLGKPITVKTDKNGRFSVAGLAPGQYDLIWSIPPNAPGNRANISTSRSNIRHGNALVLANHILHGTQQVTLTIQAGTDASGRVTSGSSADSHQSILITAKQGAITGTVVSVVH